MSEIAQMILLLLLCVMLVGVCVILAKFIQWASITTEAELKDRRANMTEETRLMWAFLEKRQRNMDAFFDEYKSRLEAREKEMDQVVIDINKRVKQACDNAAAQYAQPWLEEDTKKKSDKGELTDVFPTIDSLMSSPEAIAQIEEALAKYDL